MGCLCLSKHMEDKIEVPILKRTNHLKEEYEVLLDYDSAKYLSVLED